MGDLGALTARRAVVAGLIAAVVWIALEYRPVVRAPRLDHLVLISIDTLRADHVGAYGARPDLTPALDRLAADGVVVHDAMAPAPTTLASHASMLTGRWPHAHGVPRNGFVLPADRRTLAEHLADAGFATAGFVGATPLSAATGIGRGFAVYDAVEHAGHAERDGGAVTDAVLTHLDRVDTDQPMFLFVHYFDVHTPYGAPDGRVDDPDALRVAAADTDRRLGGFDHVREVRRRLKRGDPGAAAQSRALATLYRAGVRYADAQVGRLLRGLDHRGLLDRSLVVVTADHGETMDNPAEWWDHGYSVVEDTLHVPLLLRFPGRAHAGVTVDRLVSHVDLVPTLCELLGVPAPPTDGVSFAPTLRGEAQPPRPPAFAEATKPWRSDGTDGWANRSLPKAARQDRRKVVWDPQTGAVDAIDLDGEGARGGWPRLERALRRWAASAEPPAPTRIADPDEHALLEALGYVGE